MKEKKKYDLRRVLRRMMAHMWKQDKSQYVRIGIYTVLAGIYPFLSVFLPKIAIGILERQGTSAARPLAAAMTGYFCAAGLLAVLTSYLKAYIETRNMRIRILYLGEMCNKLQTMDYCHHEDSKFFEKYTKAMEAGNNDSSGIQGVYSRITGLPAKLLTLLGMILMAGILSPLLLGMLILHVIVMMWAAKAAHAYEYSQKEEVSRVRRRIDYFRKTTHDFSYGKDIRIFNMRERIMTNYRAEIETYVCLMAKIKGREYLYGLAGIVTLFVTNALMYATLIQGVLGGMPVSSFTMYVSMVMALMALMLDFGKDLSFIWSEGEYVDDFYRFLDDELVEQGDKTAEAVLERSKTLEIRFENVTFRYPHTEKNIFTDLNFTIHAGERLAIVGINGAGKSTLVKLMTGLFAPTSGHIYVNDVDLSTLSKTELYSLYSAVFQEVNVLAFSIRENVACASGNVDDARVRAALEKVGLMDKVEGFSKGLDQMMLKIIDENGTDFSGGERQKLSIARGLYKDAAMVIMDEPTAALDALAEAEIYENFNSLVEGKTAVYISHRLASTRFCDKIALFDENGLAEYGSHDELMEKKGKYYEMFVIQGKYYQEGVVA